MKKYICIHGHFYQPPRENPWTEKIEEQESAAPYHDWNERIAAECYLPNGVCDILENGEKVTTQNNYAWISFNFGATLLSWMQDNEKIAYQNILDADKLSVAHFGHGSALAQVYNHIIMPLANDDDKETQVIWGIKDFEHRFNRQPEGMWLAETAVDTATLEVLAKHNIKFTILAPRQAYRVKEIKENDNEWQNVDHENINPFQPYLCKLPSGNSIFIFFYDGPISQDIAFSNLLVNGEKFADRLLNVTSDEPAIVHIATDGETYGHHHKFGDRSLGYCLHHIIKDENAELCIYASYLEKFPILHEVEIFENSSWSCAHGVERWRSNCGCGSDTWHQQWRAPLRNAMDWLRDECRQIYQCQMKKFKVDPWEIRNSYIDMLLKKQDVNAFFNAYFKKELGENEKNKILELLKMQHQCLLMYTSCGWFFDELSRIEGVQIMAYASRCMELAQKFRFFSLEKKYLKILEKAKSNVPEYANGADIYNKLVKTMPRK